MAVQALILAVSVFNLALLLANLYFMKKLGGLAIQTRIVLVPVSVEVAGTPPYVSQQAVHRVMSIGKGGLIRHHDDVTGDAASLLTLDEFKGCGGDLVDAYFVRRASEL